ncbi:MAG: lysophospholipid acyltransferase family protein [bacterium]
MVYSRPVDRQEFIRRISKLLVEWGAGDGADLEERVAEALAGARADELEAFGERLASTGKTWGYHPFDPICRRISRLVHRMVLLPGSGLEASEALTFARSHPVFFVANHLSYIDANVVDALFVSGGFAEIADKATVLAGPKVFALPIRRLASLCFGTIKMPQSQSTASGEAVMPRREVARLALETLTSVAERRAKGDQLMVFIEGTRSRSATMQRVLPAAARYFEIPGTTIVPLGLHGTEKLMPLENDTVTPSVVRLRVGRAIDAAELFSRAGGKRPVVADALGFLIADLLPPEYRGDYASVTPGLQLARAAASSFRT